MPTGSNGTCTVVQMPIQVSALPVINPKKTMKKLRAIQQHAAFFVVMMIKKLCSKPKEFHYNIV
jgi:hypothetical protein